MVKKIGFKNIRLRRLYLALGSEAKMHSDNPNFSGFGLAQSTQLQYSIPKPRLITFPSISNELPFIPQHSRASVKSYTTSQDSSLRLLRRKVQDFRSIHPFGSIFAMLNFPRSSVVAHDVLPKTGSSAIVYPHEHRKFATTRRQSEASESTE